MTAAKTLPSYKSAFMSDMAGIRRAPKIFAPLDPSKRDVYNAPSLKGIVFDVDGTLW